MFNQDSLIFLISLLQLYNNFIYQFQPFNVKIIIKNNNSPDFKVLNCKHQTCFFNIYCIYITFEQIYFCDNTKLCNQKFCEIQRFYEQQNKFVKEKYL
jgi:hypothetical protein